MIKKRGNKGSIDLSFGMIFSIILIAAIIAVGFYTISYFLNLGKCTEVSLFYDDFQKAVNRAWNSEIARDEFSGSLPSGIESVCIGGLNSGNSIFLKEVTELRRFRSQNANTFLYPVKKACNQAFANIEHIDIEDSFRCFPVVNKKVKIKLDKGSFDALVKIN